MMLTRRTRVKLVGIAALLSTTIFLGISASATIPLAETGKLTIRKEETWVGGAKKAWNVKIRMPSNFFGPPRDLDWSPWYSGCGYVCNKVSRGYDCVVTAWETGTYGYRLTLVDRRGNRASGTVTFRVSEPKIVVTRVYATKNPKGGPAKQFKPNEKIYLKVHYRISGTEGCRVYKDGVWLVQGPRYSEVFHLGKKYLAKDTTGGYFWKRTKAPPGPGRYTVKGQARLVGVDGEMIDFGGTKEGQFEVGLPYKKGPFWVLRVVRKLSSAEPGPWGIIVAKCDQIPLDRKFVAPDGSGGYYTWKVRVLAGPFPDSRSLCDYINRNKIKVDRRAPDPRLVPSCR